MSMLLLVHQHQGSIDEGQCIAFCLSSSDDLVQRHSTVSPSECLDSMKSSAQDAVTLAHRIKQGTSPQDP